MIQPPQEFPRPKKRTLEQWNKRHAPSFLKRTLPPRLVQDVLSIPHPSFPEVDTDSGEGLFIYGGVGTGKTVYACQFLNTFEASNWINYNKPQTPSQFVNVSDLFEEIKATYDSHSSQTEHGIKERYKIAPLLVLDDIGLGGKVSDWFLQTLYSIVNYRYDNLLPTVITSNLSLKELDEVFGDSRITSRIRRMCLVMQKTPYDK